MSAKASQTDEMENSHDRIKAAYEAVGEALDELSVSENSDQWIALQERYFDLKAALLARDDEFQDIDLSGHDIHIPSVHHPSVENPTTQDKYGEVEMPTASGSFSVLAGVHVADPSNPHLTKAIHIDHVIDAEGNVEVQFNSRTLDELPGGDC